MNATRTDTKTKRTARQPRGTKAMKPRLDRLFTSICSSPVFSEPPGAVRRWH